MSETTLTEDARPCPFCGYDLRALVGTRCNECGEDVSRLDLAANRLPWMNRGELGFGLAFRQTNRIVQRQPQKVAHELARPVDDQEARRFLMTVSLPCAAMTGASAVVAFMVRVPLDKLVTSQVLESFMANKAADLFLPLLMGIHGSTMGLAVFLLVWMLPRGLTLPFAILRAEGRPSERAVRGAALTRYLGAALVPLTVSAMMAAGVLILAELVPNMGRSPVAGIVQMGAAVIGGLCFALFLYVTVVGMFVLLRRAGAEWIHLLLAAGVLAVHLALCVVTAVIFGIWLPGYVRIALRVIG